jgi:hypothetical protein
VQSGRNVCNIAVLGLRLTPLCHGLIREPLLISGISVSLDFGSCEQA